MKHPHLQIQAQFGFGQEKGQELLEEQDVFSQLQPQEANARLSLHHKNPQSTNLCYPDPALALSIPPWELQRKQQEPWLLRAFENHPHR